MFFLFFLFCIPCLLLLLYFIALGIFIPAKRHYVREAWDCFKNRVLLRPCEMSFDKKMKARLSAWFMARGHPRAAAFFYKHFDSILTALFLVMVVTSIYLAWLAYEWWFVKPPCPPTPNGVC